jgi:Protein phosphatase 2C
VARCSFAAQTSKELDRPELNEDVFAFDPAVTRIALSDGASESFDSRTFAHLLVKSFERDPRPNSEWLARTLEQYESGIDLTALSWSQQAAFERGSFATLLGVEVHESDHQVAVFGVGDSVAVFVEEGALLRSFPLQTSEEFREKPRLFSTRAGANGFTCEPNFCDRHSIAVGVTQATTLLLMTDAIAAWFLASVENATEQWRRLLTLGSPEELQALVQQERATGAMRVDDVTLLRVQFDIG